MNELIQSILNEKFARDHRLQTMTLQSIESSLEEAAPEFSELDELDSQQLEEAQSFERCRNNFCLLLMELESRNLLEMMDRSLEELQNSLETPPEKTNSEAVSASLAMPDLADVVESEDAISEKTMMALGIEAALEEVSPIAQPEDMDSSMEIPDLEPELPEIEMQVESLLGDNMVPPPLNPAVADMVEEEWEVKPTAFEAAPPTKVEPKVETVPTIAKVQEVAEESSVPDSHMTSPIAEEFFHLAKYFEGATQIPTVANSRFHWQRLSAQNFCFAVESECIERLMPGLTAFWTNRGEAVRPFLDANGKRGDLHPELKQALDELASTQENGAFDIPYAGVATALKYLLAVPEPDAFRPSLLEAGTLLLLFGQDAHWGGIKVRNLLGVEGLSEVEVTELAARLIRMHKLKLRSVSPSVNRDDDWINEVKTEAGAVLPLVSKLISKTEDRLDKAG